MYMQLLLNVCVRACVCVRVHAHFMYSMYTMYDIYLYVRMHFEVLCNVCMYVCI